MPSTAHRLTLLKRIESHVRSIRFAVAPAARREFADLLAERLATGRLDAGRWAYLDIRSHQFDGPQGRLVHALFTLFQRAGFRVAFRARRSFLSNFSKRPLKALLLSRDFRIVSSDRQMPDGYWWVGDSLRTQPQGRPEKRIQLLRDGPLSNDDDFFAMPFPLFPSHYERDSDLRIADFRNRPKHWRLFFGGSTTRKSYSRSQVSDRYGKVGRARIIDLLMSSLPQQRVVTVDSVATLARLREGYFDGAVIIDGQSYRSPEAQWLELVAASDCFLAAPGVSRPMSHNIIESLAVGVPPLNEYPEYFDPPLRNGHESINYQGEAGFIESLQRLMAGPVDGLLAQGSEAAAYYDANLRFDSFMRKIENCRHASVRLHIAPHEQVRT